MKIKNNKALKEWATIVKALGKGKQTIFIRRRIIKKGREFFLYPTFGPHQNKRTVQENFHLGLEEALASKSEKHIELKYYATVQETIKVSDAEKLLNLAPHYVWTPSHVIDFLRTSRENKLFLIIIRIFELSQPVYVKPRRSMNWVNLPNPIPTEGCKPVLTEGEFEERVSSIQKIIGGPT